ncbi:MAG TPA: hypothetical protein VF421_09800 [Niabella sp.]
MNTKEQNNDGGKVPLFKSWTGWYMLVLLFLAGVIVVCYWLTKKYS